MDLTHFTPADPILLQLQRTLIEAQAEALRATSLLETQRQRSDRITRVHNLHVGFSQGFERLIALMTDLRRNREIRDAATATLVAAALEPPVMLTPMEQSFLSECSPLSVMDSLTAKFAARHLLASQRFARVHQIMTHHFVEDCTSIQKEISAVTRDLHEGLCNVADIVQPSVVKDLEVTLAEAQRIEALTAERYRQVEALNKATRAQLERAIALNLARL